MKFSLQTDPAELSPPPSTATADLPSLGRPAPRRLPKPVKLGLVLLVLAGAAVAAWAGIPGVKGSVEGLFAAEKTDMITAVVKPTKLSVIVKERGILESAANKDMISEVEGTTTIIKIEPEGTKVNEGDVVCILDSAVLRDTLTNQRITTQQAEASFKQSQLTREVAEYAVKEYVEGVYKQDLATAKGEIALAKSDLERAEDRVKWSADMYIKGYVSQATKIADTLTLDRAKFDLEQAQTQLEVLEKYTKDKQTKSLNSDVEKARADELSKQSSLELERTKEAKLVRQIDKCTLKAPGSGIVVYANDPNRQGGQAAIQIEEGASVRERQKIFSLPDITRMRVNTKVHESMVERVKPGRPALIRVEASAGKELQGHVVTVAPMADQNAAFASDIKVYTTYVAIDGDTAKMNLRPGMNSQVEILIDELDKVLSVPVQAILPFRGKYYAFVKAGDGFKREEIELGISNDQHVEVKKGIKEGDVVAMTPNALLTSEERQEAFNVAAKDASKKEFGAATTKGIGPGGDQGSPDSTKGDGAPKAKAKGKRAGGGGGMMGSPEERAKLLNASPEEQRKILLERGVPEERIDGMLERMKSGGGGGGPGGGGPGGGGFGGGGPGGPGL